MDARDRRDARPRDFRAIALCKGHFGQRDFVEAEGGTWTREEVDDASRWFAWLDEREQ